MSHPGRRVGPAHGAGLGHRPAGLGPLHQGAHAPDELHVAQRHGLFVGGRDGDPDVGLSRAGAARRVHRRSPARAPAIDRAIRSRSPKGPPMTGKRAPSRCRGRSTTHGKLRRGIPGNCSSLMNPSDRHHRNASCPIVELISVRLNIREILGAVETAVPRPPPGRRKAGAAVIARPKLRPRSWDPAPLPAPGTGIRGRPTGPAPGSVPGTGVCKLSGGWPPRRSLRR